MIKINDECDGGYEHEENGVRARRTTITQPEHGLYAYEPDHEQIVNTPFLFEQFPPIAVASKDDLPPEYEPLKRYID